MENEIQEHLTNIIVSHPSSWLDLLNLKEIPKHRTVPWTPFPEGGSLQMHQTFPSAVSICFSNHFQILMFETDAADLFSKLKPTPIPSYQRPNCLGCSCTGSSLGMIQKSQKQVLVPPFWFGVLSSFVAPSEGAERLALRLFSQFIWAQLIHYLNQRINGRIGFILKYLLFFFRHF